MNYRLSPILFALLAILGSAVGHAGVDQLSETEFRSLANDLALKVNLFRDAWEKDPEAVFYGGTSRDYLYWLKGQFREAKSKSQAERIAAKLRALPMIDVRSFIVGESDVDVITPNSMNLRPEHYGVRKLDKVPPSILDPASDLGRNELWQGYIPAEKIKLAKNGIAPATNLGDGLKEIYSGKLSVHYAPPEKFAQTTYAKQGENHPILLALRYLRLQAINYFQDHGEGLPDSEKLLRGFDPASKRETEKVIAATLDGKELRPFLANHRFKSWINGTIQKSFRSYTNPNAALELAEKFHVSKLSELYGSENIEPVHQYVFAQYRDPALIRKNLEKFKTDEKLFYQSPEITFPDGYLYHGTKTEPAFRNILFQGILPSADGSGGAGLYGVASGSRGFAEDWGGDKNRLLRFPVRPEAKLVDVTNGEGQRVYSAFVAANKLSNEGYSEFAKAFGVDILRYPYGTQAFVVKNSAALGKAEGVHRQLLSFNHLMDRMPTMKDPAEFVRQVTTNQYSTQEIEALLSEAIFPESELAEAVAEGLAKDFENTRRAFNRSDFWHRHKIFYVPSLLQSSHIEDVAEALHSLDLQDPQRSHIAAISMKGSTNEDTSRLLMIFLKEHKGWSHYKEALTSLSDSSKIGKEAARMLIPLLEELPPSEKIPIFEKIIQQGDTHLHRYVVQDVLTKPSAELVPVMKEFVRRNWDLWDRNYPTVINHWNQFPEVIEVYLENNNISMVTEFFIKELPDDWLKHTDTMRKFLQWKITHMKYNTPHNLDISGIDAPDWHKNPDFWRRYLHSLPDEFHNKHDLIKLATRYIAQEELWNKSEDLMSDLLKVANAHHDLYPIWQAAAAGKIDPQKNPRLVKEMIAHLTGNTSTSLHAAITKSANWGSSPLVLEEVLKLYRAKAPLAGVTFSATNILRSPALANHPELLEEFVRIGPQTLNEKNQLQELLALPHWRDHPRYTALKKNNQISLGKMKSFALAVGKEPLSPLQKMRVSCATAFGSLKNVPLP